MDSFYHSSRERNPRRASQSAVRLQQHLGTLDMQLLRPHPNSLHHTGQEPLSMAEAGRPGGDTAPSGGSGNIPELDPGEDTRCSQAETVTSRTGAGLGTDR